MDVTPDAITIWQYGPITLTATVFYSWVVMAILIISTWLITRKLSTGVEISRWQNMLESIVVFTRDQIDEAIGQKPDKFMPFLGTLFLFISISNFLSFVPVYQPPTGSIHTTAVLALCVFFAVPIYGISSKGFKGYFKHYIKPSPVMLPFNIISELSRTLSMAVRLFGNVMSGTIIAGILLSIAPLFVPVIMSILELLIGQIQAYIFAILATVYIGSATRVQRESEENEND